MLGKPDYEIVRLVGLVCDVELARDAILQGNSFSDLLPDPGEAGEIVKRLTSAYGVLGKHHDGFVASLDTVADILVTQVLKGTGDPDAANTLGHEYGNRISVMTRFDTVLQSNAFQLHQIWLESELHKAKTKQGKPTRRLNEQDVSTAQILFRNIFEQAVKKLIEYK